MRIFHGSKLLTLCVFLGLLAAGCSDRVPEAAAPEIAVTNSYLEAIVRDLCGTQTTVMSLAPPGMCPGHFDISPSQVRQLQGCRMLLLFDFQSQVASALSRLKDKGLKMHLVKGRKGLCVPDSYLASCREVAAILSSEYPERAGELAGRIELIEQRLGTLSGQLRSAVADSGSVSSGVLTSHHQAEFAEWLGLATVATFVGSDTETIASVDHCLKQAAGQDVRFVIANQQEGTSLAKALAERLEAQAVIFSNFPPQTNDGSGFDRLLRSNVERLLEAVAQ